MFVLPFVSAVHLRFEWLLRFALFFAFWFVVVIVVHVCTCVPVFIGGFGLWINFLFYLNVAMVIVMDMVNDIGYWICGFV